MVSVFRGFALAAYLVMTYLFQLLLVEGGGLDVVDSVEV